MRIELWAPDDSRSVLTHDLESGPRSRQSSWHSVSTAPAFDLPLLATWIGSRPVHWLGLVRCATLCCLLVLLAGCASSSIDVLPDDSEGRGYYVGMALELRADRLVQKPSCSLCPGESPSLVARALIQHDKLYGGHVEDVSVDAYRRDPDAYANWIVGVAPAGTRVEVTRVVRRSAFLGLEATYEVLARFVSGSYSGTTIHLDSVSRYGVDRRPNVDPTELSIVR